MRVGIDWGGTKIEGIVLEPSTGKEILRKRVDAPKDNYLCLLYTSPSPRDRTRSRMPSSA